MNHKLYDKIMKADMANIMTCKGYHYFTNGEYNVNIIGVRAYNKDNRVTNAFDDFLVVTYKNNWGWVKKAWSITTEPGLVSMKGKLFNPKGTAILSEGQYISAYKFGKHKGQYEALVQARPVKVFRDGNKDDVYDMNPETIENGCFGINIHRSNPYMSSVKVDNWSAGCQVFSNPNDFTNFLNLCNKSRDLYGDAFTYTLINETDLEYGGR